MMLELPEDIGDASSVSLLYKTSANMNLTSILKLTLLTWLAISVVAVCVCVCVDTYGSNCFAYKKI